MALVNGKSRKLYGTYRESTSSTPETTGRFELHGDMALPQPTYMQESNKGKLGTGQHGTETELQSIYTPFSYAMAQRFSEFLYLMSFAGMRDNNVQNPSGSIYNQDFRLLAASGLTMPTVTLEYGDGTTNDVLTGVVINDCSVTIPLDGGNGVWEASFNGFGNKHYDNSGTLTKIASGSISSGAEDTSAEPLLNGKCCSVWRSTALEAGFGQSSIDFTGTNLLATATEITSLVNSITFTLNMGMTGEDGMRGGGCGVINNYTRKQPAVTLSMNLRKDVSVIDFHAQCLADTQSAIEILFQGPTFSGATRYALDMFFPVVQIQAAPEDREIPISGDVTFEVFEDSNGDAFRAFAQTPIDEGYNQA